MKTNNIYIVLVAVVSLTLAACSGQYRAVSHAALLDYHDSPTYGNLKQLAEAYAVTINSAYQADTIHPGLLADYGVTLAMLGEEEEANRMFNREIKAFPQSAPYVNELKRRLTPDFVNDTSTGTSDTVNLAILSSIMLDSITAERLVPYQISIIDSTDTARLRKQTPADSVVAPLRLTANQKRERLAEEQQAAAKLKKEQDEAKIQAKKDRERAKKEADREKKQLKKQREKERKAQQKQREKEREQLKKQREQEREAARAQREAEKKEAAKNKQNQPKQ